MTLTPRHGRRELLPALAPLWNALFEHHLSVGAAGLPTIPHSESWPLRRAHYERLAAEHSGVSIWLAGRSTPLRDMHWRMRIMSAARPRTCSRR